MSFEDRLKKKVADDIGNLLSDEDLSRIVAEGVRRVFFDQRQQDPNDWGRRIAKEPLADELVRNAALPMVKTAIEAWLAEHNAEVLQTVERVLQQGMTTALVSTINAMAALPLRDFTIEFAKRAGVPDHIANNLDASGVRYG
jgi:hypothetical protein